MAEATELKLHEGVLLGHALVSHVAAEVGIRVFFIKGPASRMQGLREPGTSSDVDVFADPFRVLDLVKALEGRGWRLRPSDPDEIAFPRHSATLYHPNWPNDIDVHHRYPGMERSDAIGFDVLWANTTEISMAGTVVRIPNVPLAVCFIALHSLRTPQMASSLRELDFLYGLDLESYKDQIFHLCVALESVAPMAPFLVRRFGHVPPAGPQKLSDEWKRRTASTAPGTARILAILAVPMREKPLLILRGFFPSRDGMAAKDSLADVSFRGRIVHNFARWKLLVSSLSTTVLEVREYYRAHKDAQRL